MSVPSSVPGSVPSSVPSKKRANSAGKAGLSPVSLASSLFVCGERKEEREGGGQAAAIQLGVQCVSPRDTRDSRDSRDSPPLTANQYRRRIERLFRAVEWGYSNPFAEIVRERVESGRAEFAAEVAEAKSVKACPF